MKRISLIAALLLMSVPAFGSNQWFIRNDGAGRYDANRVAAGFTGAAIGCDGLGDAPYPGSGTNQHCAFNDYRFLYDDQTNGNSAWVIAGGDTVIIRGCAHNANQPQDASPNCRVGWDNNTGPGAGYTWCIGGDENDCSNPPIPAGTSSQHTRILGQNYASCNTGGATNPKNYESQLNQLFGGFGTPVTLNLASTQYVDVECLEITTHTQAVPGTNGTCTIHGSPAYPVGCDTSVGSSLSDYDSDGIYTGNTTANILLQDVYIHGHGASGIQGPIGAGVITMTRVFDGFNTFAGWNFDDGSDTPDATGAQINANYVYMIGNGFSEEFPIVDAFPAVTGYDLNSAGFGDSWSGQDTDLDTFTCNHCYMEYNTKDGFIGPHTHVKNLTITNSVSAFNMGQQWKWGNTINATTTVESNLTIQGCNRLSAALTGAPSNYNQYLSLFCRASGDVFSFSSDAGGHVLLANNTTIAYSQTVFDLNCNTANNCATTTYTFLNNINLGYTVPSGYYPGANGQAPGLYYLSDSSDVITASYNDEYGMRNGTCPGGTGMVCTDPLLVNEPAQGSVPPESAFDEFLSSNNSGLYLTGSSPAIHAGTTGGPATFFDGTSQTSPATIGAMPTATTPPSGPTNVLSGTVTTTGPVTTIP